jgi:uncharacterized repeat protein (TIGR01451 family)
VARGQSGWRTRLLLCLSLVISATGLAVLLPSAPAAFAATASFTYTGAEQTYIVPLGVTSVTIQATGAPGGTGVFAGAPGGLGALVTATVPVSPGETLYVEVGGPGVTGACTGTSSTGRTFNGGGSTDCGGSGGGASDVRTCPMATCPDATPDTRLVVAGGGGGSGGAENPGLGGAGGQGGDPAATGAGNGGAASNAGPAGPGVDGGFGPPAGTGGPGTVSFPCTGDNGATALGGNVSGACYDGAGAGGGGYDGGGAGGDGFGGGGGGAGSSFWDPAATGTSMVEDTTGVPQVTVTPGPTSGSEVNAVIQVATSPQFAGEPVTVSSLQLQIACGGTITFETLQGGSTIAPRTQLNAITLILDDDGNATVVVEGVDCSAGTDLIEADLPGAPYLTATTELVVLPPQVTTTGVAAYPSSEVETSDSPAIGASDVYTVFYVETDPVYAEQTVDISSAQLENRCGEGWLWEPGTGTPINQTSGTTTASGTLDNDGNAIFVFKGASCAAGPSTVTADVLAGTHPTYTTTFTVEAPQATVAATELTAGHATKNKKVAAPKHHRHRSGGSAPPADPPAMTVTASPNPLVETGGGEPSTTALSITKTDAVGGSSITGAVGTVYPGDEVDYTITVANNGSTEVDGVQVQDNLPSAIDFDRYFASETGGASGFTFAGFGNIDDVLDLPAHSSVVYSVTGVLNCGLPGGGTLSNTATLSPPGGSTLSATDTDNIGPNEC